MTPVGTKPDRDEDDQAVLGILEEYLPPMGTKTNVSTTATDIGEYTGEILKRRVTLVYRGGQFGIPNGYCIMSVVPLKEGDLGFA